MIICDNGIIREMTQEEVIEMESKRKHYFDSTSYDELVNEKIREKYSISQEFSILRQKDEKPEEYQQYYNYCEECKIYVKEHIKG